jgi:hypothetical protein
MPDTTTYGWRIEAGERSEISFPVLDSAGDEVDVEGWTVDAKIRTRPGGTVLYTFPTDYVSIDSSGTVTVTIPAPVSKAWAFTAGWYRVVITDPDSSLDDPDSQRVVQGVVVIDPD